MPDLGDVVRGTAEAVAPGRGGTAAVARATGIAPSTIRRGRVELASGDSPGPGRVRRAGAGRKRLTEKDPKLLADLERLVDGDSRGDPEQPLRWTAKSLRTLAAAQPVISVDTKKKELVGDFKNQGREWRPKGSPELVRSHDFKDKELGKAIPYGIYDLASDEGWVAVGIDHDTAQFAVNLNLPRFR